MGELRASQDWPKSAFQPATRVTVVGEAVELGGRRIVRLASASTMVKRRAFVGKGVERAYARGSVVLRPIGLVERWNGYQRTVFVHDATCRALRCMAIAGLLIPIALLVAQMLPWPSQRSSRKEA